MAENKVRIISYVTPDLREQLSEIADEEACSESGIVTRALLALFRERERWNQHIKNEKMMAEAQSIVHGQNMTNPALSNFLNRVEEGPSPVR